MRRHIVKGVAYGLVFWAWYNLVAFVTLAVSGAMKGV